jgi:hypothetical protein
VRKSTANENRCRRKEHKREDEEEGGRGGGRGGGEGEERQDLE